MILLPIVGNAAEHAGAIIFAFKNNLVSIIYFSNNATNVEMFSNLRINDDLGDDAGYICRPCFRFSYSNCHVRGKKFWISEFSQLLYIYI